MNPSTNKQTNKQTNRYSKKVPEISDYGAANILNKNVSEEEIGTFKGKKVSQQWLYQHSNELIAC